MNKYSKLIFLRARSESAGSAAALVVLLLLQTCMMRPDPCPDRPGTAVVQWSELPLHLHTVKKKKQQTFL